MDIGKQHDGFCPHHVEVPQRGAGDMEPGKERVIRQPGVHAIHCADNIIAPSLHCSGIIHLIHADRCRGFPDNPRDLAMGKKITFPS